MTPNTNRIERFANAVMDITVKEYTNNPELSPKIGLGRILEEGPPDGPSVETVFLPDALVSVVMDGNAKKHLPSLIKVMLSSERVLTWRDGTEEPPSMVVVIAPAYGLRVESKEQLDDILEHEQRDKLEDHPDAQELLLVQVHTLTGTSVLTQDVHAGQPVGERTFIPPSECLGDSMVMPRPDNFN